MAYEMKKTDSKVMTLSAVQERLIKSFNEEIRNKQLEVPANYSASNAIKFAVTDIRRLGLDKTCNINSIGKALGYMVRLGLDPTKKQCYFWANKVYEGYGNNKRQVATDCDMFKSYFGDEACAYRTGLVVPNGITARPIYKDDTFKTATKNNQMIIVDHNTAFENLDKPIIGGYCVIQLKDGSEVWTVMTMKEITIAWGKAKNSGSVQQEFPQEMVKRTLIRRCCKNFFNANPVADTVAQNKLIQTYNEATEKEYDNTKEDNVVADLDDDEAEENNSLSPIADDNGEIKAVEEKKEDINQATEVQNLSANIDKEGK